MHITGNPTAVKGNLFAWFLIFNDGAGTEKFFKAVPLFSYLKKRVKCVTMVLYGLQSEA